MVRIISGCSYSLRPDVDVGMHELSGTSSSRINTRLELPNNIGEEIRYIGYYTDNLIKLKSTILPCLELYRFSRYFV